MQKNFLAWSKNCDRAGGEPLPWLKMWRKKAVETPLQRVFATMITAYMDKLQSGFGLGLFLFGAFYVFAGWFACRQFRTELLLDRALDAIAGEKPDPVDRARLIWLIVGGVVTFAAGASLMALSSLAIWLFAFGFLQQVVYIFIVAPRLFDIDEPPDPRGRRQTTNAAIIFGVVALGVAWAGARGALLPILAEGAPFSVVVLVVVMVFASRTLFGTARTPESPLLSALESLPEDGDHEIALQDIVAIRLAAEIDQWPIEVDVAGGETRRISPEPVFGDALCRDLLEWQDRFDDIFEPADPAAGRMWTTDEKAAHFHTAAVLARRMRGELDGAGLAAVAISYVDEDDAWVEVGEEN